MPYTAYHPESDDIHFVSQADPEGDYCCIDCKVGVSYVRPHERDSGGGTTSQVDAHFRYYQCTHGTVDEVSEGSGGGGGGGGSGESDLHKRRKRAALQEALNQFPAADYGTEVQIGTKRADALLQFEEGHSKYGKGLVIEYQHKNEGKDIEETQIHFAKHGYTTVWLWEDQFSFTSSIPDIDLFGGQVYTPWPDVVPDRSQWAPPGQFYELREKWQRAHHSGLTDAVVEATVYKDWVVPTQEEHWRQTAWSDRFRVENQRLMRDYILQVAVGGQPSSVTVPATLYRDWLLPKPAEYWRSEPWFRRFSSTHVYPCDIYIDDALDGEKSEIHREIPFSEWVRKADGDRPEQIVAAVLIAYNEGKLDPPNTQTKRSKALETVESVVRHHSSDKSGISLNGLLTVASSYIGVPSDHVRWAVGKLKSEGTVVHENGEYRLSH